MRNTTVRFCVILLFLSFTATAQLSNRNVLGKYTLPAVRAALLPYGSWKPFPQTPAAWKEAVPDTVIAGMIANGEKALKKDFVSIPATVTLQFVRDGNRTAYEALSFAKRNQLFDLVLAESAEGKGRFTDQIVNGVWNICEESFWGVTAHIGMQNAGAGLPDVQDPVVDLFAAETAAVLAWTDYFVGPRLDSVSKLVRQRIAFEMNKRILQPMATAKYGWMGAGNPQAKLNNWAPWIMSNYVVAALLFEKEEDKRAAAVYRALQVTNQYMNSLGDDGGCDEGPGYWFAAGGAVFDELAILNDASKGAINVYGDPFVDKMASYIYKTHIAGNYFVNVADAHPRISPDGAMLYRFGKALNDTQLTGFGSWIYHDLPNGDSRGIEQFRRTRDLYNLLAIKTIAADRTPYTPVNNAWFPDVQLMIARLSNGLFLSAHAGNNHESHNHNDIGDFAVYASGDPVLIDVGSGTYTSKTFSKHRYDIWYNTSAYHNLPTINGVQQGDGAFSATAVSYNNDKNGTSFQMELREAYPATAGISSWKRNIVTSHKGVITITDRFAAAAPLQSLTQGFITVCAADINQPGKIVFTTASHNQVVLQYDAAFWAVSKEKMPLDAPEDQGLKVNWRHQDIYRILLTAKRPGKAGVLQYTVTR
ncbi:heparinase II/III domain-containing protein [Deminuibacter soli]|nr:heparinase II/III family protein [Deminuibacter soli]